MANSSWGWVHLPRLAPIHKSLGEGCGGGVPLKPCDIFCRIEFLGKEEGVEEEKSR